MAINVKIKRFVSEGASMKFPLYDMHVWLTSSAISELGILEASLRGPQYVKIECKAPLNKFTIYAGVASLNQNIEVEEGFVWIPSDLVHKSIIFDKNTEVEVSALNIEECIEAESVTIKLKEDEVETWSEDEATKAIKNYRLKNGIVFLNQCTFVKPMTKNVVIGIVDSIFPRPSSFTQPYRVTKETKIFLEGLPKSQQKVIDFNQIGGLGDVIEKLREIIQLPITCPEQLIRFGVKPPKGMLMYGPPGNGKTMIARAVAQSMGSSFISIEGPELMSKYVGVGEQRLREKFEEAETKGNSVIFIDEIDSIASVRSDSAAEYQVSIVATLLNLMDGMKSNNVFVIGATNRINAIDPALRRPGRFDLEFEVPLPSTPARLDILGKYIKLEKTNLFDESVSKSTLHRIAELTNGYSGADLSLLYREAAMIAIRRNIRIDSRTGKLENTSIEENSRIKAEDFYEAMKHIVPTSKRDIDSKSYNVQWDDLLCADKYKEELKSLDELMERLTDSENLQCRPSAANLIINGQTGSGRHTLIHSFASKFGYEVVDVDLMKLQSLSLTEAFVDIEKKFSKAKQIAPSVVTISNLTNSDIATHLLEKVISEANGINKRSKVLVVLINDADVVEAEHNIGYKKFGKCINLTIPSESEIADMLNLYNVPEKDRHGFTKKPIGQLISEISEYSICNK